MPSNCGAGEDSLESLGQKRRSNQPILREINTEYSLEGLILKLKLQYFGHLMQTADSLEKSLMLGKMESRRRRGCQRMRWLDGITDAIYMSLGKLWEICWESEGQRGLACCSPWCHKEMDTTGRPNNSIAGSPCCTPETNNVVKQQYSNEREKIGEESI